MRILIVDDEPVGRRVAEVALAGLGHEIELASDGMEAWRAIIRKPFDVVISDWMMPELDGLELCRRVRKLTSHFTFMMLVTARDQMEDLVQGLHSGADDFITKPFSPDELRARLHAAERVIRLERTLEEQVAALQRALKEVRTLRGLLPICMYCKSIQATDEAWQRIEAYISDHSNAEFTHAICPTCYSDRVKPMLEEYRSKCEDAKRSA